MRRAPSISAAQFFGTAFGCRAALTIALNGRWAAGENLLDGAFSCLGQWGWDFCWPCPWGFSSGAAQTSPLGTRLSSFSDREEKRSPCAIWPISW